MDRVLAFGCHPDDVEFMCAGTLALLARQGYEIHLATMTGGEVGSPNLTSPQIKAIRLKEAEAAAKQAGWHYHYAGGCDLEVEFSSEYRRLTTRVIRKVDPLIVLTHAPTCYMADHEETSRLVRNACYIASIPLYDNEAGLAPTTRFPYLYYWNAMGCADILGRPLPMQVGVDIGSVVDLKERLAAVPRIAAGLAGVSQRPGRVCEHPARHEPEAGRSNGLRAWRMFHAAPRSRPSQGQYPEKDSRRPGPGSAGRPERVTL